MRLNKFIADCGICSRRKADQLIEQGEISVNGRVVSELGVQVNPNADIVEYQGSILNYDHDDRIYLLFHKPRGVICSVSDPEGRKTVMDFMPKIHQRLYPVGRLDYLSEGLLLMTNDGDLAQKVLHPSNEVEKVYEVKVFGIVSEDLLKKLRAGVRIGGEMLKPESVRILKFLREKTWLEIRLVEGKNREIRRLCEDLGVTIDKLRRVAIGRLSISGIGPGNFVFVDKTQIEKLMSTSDVRYMSTKKSVTVNRRRKMRFDGKERADSEVFQKIGVKVKQKLQTQRKKQKTTEQPVIN